MIAVGFLIALLVGALGGALLSRKKTESFETVQMRIKALLEQTQKECQALRTKTQEEIARFRTESENELQRFSETLQKLETALVAKDTLVQKKEQRLEEYRLGLARENEKVAHTLAAIKTARRDAVQALAVRAGTTEELLKKKVVDEYSQHLSEEQDARLAHHEEYIREQAEREAKHILIDCMQRMGAILAQDDYTEKIVIPRGHDPIKSQLIGPEAKHIHLFEELLEVDVIFNDFPNTISIACYNLVNRRIAKITYEKLLRKKGLFTEATIRSTIEEAKRDMDKTLHEIGMEVIKKLPIKKDFTFHPDLVKIIGRLQFRTSYGQNIMRHSLEVGYVARMMADELHLKTDIAHIGGFLHDLGKAIDQNPDVIGAHDYLTKELMEKYGFSWEETHAAWTHHEAEKPSTPEAMMVKGADAVSAGRPGARQESLEKYIERIRLLESIAGSYEGVQKTFAISAGRELRVIVNPELLADERLAPLASDMAGRIEKEVAYPGVVRVNVIRKTKVSDIAKPFSLHHGGKSLS